MTCPIQSPRDRILWILTNSSGKMDRSRLRRCSGLKQADLNIILGELAREGRIRISGETITLSWMLLSYVTNPHKIISKRYIRKS